MSLSDTFPNLKWQLWYCPPPSLPQHISHMRDQRTLSSKLRQSQLYQTKRPRSWVSVPLSKPRSRIWGINIKLPQPWGVMPRSHRSFLLDRLRASLLHVVLSFVWFTFFLLTYQLSSINHGKGLCMQCRGYWLGFGFILLHWRNNLNLPVNVCNVVKSWFEILSNQCYKTKEKKRNIKQ